MGERPNCGKVGGRALNMGNPVLVEVRRGALVESRHRGAIAVADAAGRLAFSVGDVEPPVYPRSAIKAMQALVLVESGAADRFGVGHRGTGAGLRVAWRRAGPCRDRRPAAGARRARCVGAALRRALADAPAVGAGAGARRRAGERAAQQLLRQARGFSLCRLRDGRRHGELRRAGASGAARGQGGARKPDRRGAVAGCLRDRRLLGADLGDAAGRAGARLRPVRQRRGHGPGPGESRAKASRGLRRAPVARRRHRTLLHRGHARVRRPRVRQDRRRGRVLRGAAGTGARHRRQMRRRRRTRRRGDDGGGDRAASRVGRRSRRAGALRAAHAAQLERRRGRLAAGRRPRSNCDTDAGKWGRRGLWE